MGCETTAADAADCRAGAPGAARCGQGPAADARPSALSPSRAGDFLTCPLLYRFRVIDRLPEPPSPAAARGTLVHAVLEQLFDQPGRGADPGGGALARRAGVGAADRRGARAGRAVRRRGRAGRPGWTGPRPCSTATSRWRTRGGSSPPTASCTSRPSWTSGLQLRGYIDRLDVAPGGEIRIVDYKTGTSPREEFEARALFQMKFYALVIWRLRGVIPRHAAADVPGQRRDRAVRARRGRPARHRAQGGGAVAGDRAGPVGGRLAAAAERLCDWCAHQAICPAFGGTPPPLPERRRAEASPAPPGEAQPAAAG